MQERATKGWPEGRGSGNERVKERGGDLGGSRAFAVRMGQAKTKALQAGLPDS
jgi:hypothetical protein